MKVAHDITRLIGNTPMVRINSMGGGAEIFAKLESWNPLSSIKDRIGLAMIESLAIYCLLVALILLFVRW